jgi:hypothetical protein
LSAGRREWYTIEIFTDETTCEVVTIESLIIHKKIIETVFLIRKFLGLPDPDPFAEVRIWIQNSKKKLDFYSFVAFL